LKNKLRNLSIKGNLKNRTNRVVQRAIFKDRLKTATDIFLDRDYDNLWIEILSAIETRAEKDFSDIELEMLVNALQDANIKGKNVFAYCGNGNCTEDVKLYSANATIEGAYKKVYGCTKSEFIKGVKQRMASLKHSYKNNVQEMGK